MSSVITSTAYFDLLFHQRKRKNVLPEETDVLGNASVFLSTVASSTRCVFQSLLTLFFPCIV